MRKRSKAEKNLPGRYQSAQCWFLLSRPSILLLRLVIPLWMAMGQPSTRIIIRRAPSSAVWERHPKARLRTSSWPPLARSLLFGRPPGSNRRKRCSKPSSATPMGLRSRTSNRADREHLPQPSAAHRWSGPWNRVLRRTPSVGARQPIFLFSALAATSPKCHADVPSLLPQWVQRLRGQTQASLEVRDAQRSAPPGGLVLLSDPLCVYEFILSLQAFHQTK